MIESIEGLIGSNISTIIWGAILWGAFLVTNWGMRNAMDVPKLHDRIIRLEQQVADLTEKLDILDGEVDRM
ncbi:hypothetical protein ABS772_21445 [Methylorubrum podarium]|uniref:Uncharacterized protein n=1 Tax=Methylorubrum podarium TaxID=200476 RepID=A0ABV1QT19_9HYPH